ncbi:hypothetical protein VZT92_023885 [Zoarces viviparus]|uniref:Uncharacterized protein n=1 Tax=Zoarces viviparus TaxID=48416 RepID=A0AAW1E8S1_ZOAVI
MQKNILQNTTINATVEKLIMSFGVCNRDQKPKETSIKQLQGMWRAARGTFPAARIYIPRNQLLQRPASEREAELVTAEHADCPTE